MTFIPTNPNMWLQQERDLRSLADLPNLQQNYLGMDIAVKTARQLIDQMNNQADPDGFPWPALDPAYASWKASTHPGLRIGELLGEMKRYDNMIGELDISPKRLRMTYGRNPIAKWEATKFQEGALVTFNSQPPRRFYFIGAANHDKMGDRIDDSLDAVYFRI